MQRSFGWPRNSPRIVTSPPDRYIQADLCVDDFRTIGLFDTVTALHVLGHFTEDEMYQVVANPLAGDRASLDLCCAL